MSKAKKLLVNIVALTATALVMRTIGVSFSAYLFNRVGASAMGVYQLILSVYGFAITIASSGIKFTVTRLISEEYGKDNGIGMKTVMRKCFRYAFFFSVPTSLVLFFSADFIGLNLLDDVSTVAPLKVLAIGLPFIAFSHVITGFFTAIRKIMVGSAIMIIDQLIMIVVTITLLGIFIEKGLMYICLALVIGSVLSEIVTCLLLFWHYYTEKRHLKHGTSPNNLWSRLCSLSLPIAFSAYARSGLYTLQNILIPKGLRKHGDSSSAAFAAYGTVHGMVLPMVLYPSALLVALSELLIPELTECQVQKNHTQIHYIIKRVFQCAFLFTVGVMGILFYFARELSGIFEHNPEVAFYLKLFAPLVLVMYMDTVVDGMLKGLGEQLQSMKYNVIDALFSVLLVFFLVPIYGIKGYVIMVMLSELLNFTLSLSRLIKVTQVQIQWFHMVVKPLVCMVSTVAVFSLVLSPPQWSAQLLPSALVAKIALFFGGYLLGLYLSGCLKKEDFRWFASLVK